MSTTTVSYSATTDEVSLRELRRKEAEARKALRRRLGKAQQAIAVQETRYAKLVESLDEHRAHLPDLAFAAPVLPPAPVGQNPESFESYAMQLAGLVDRYERQAQRAIVDAQVVLERRKQLAAAWTEIHAAAAEIAVRNQACAALAQQLGNRFDAKVSTPLSKIATLEEAQAYLKNIRTALGQLQAQHICFEKLAATRSEISTAETKIVAYRQDCVVLSRQLNQSFNAPMSPSLLKTATLEEAQTHLKNIRATLEQLQAQHQSLEHRVHAREKALILSGDSVIAVSSESRISAWEAEKGREARNRVSHRINTALAASKLAEDSLPKALQLQIAFALEQAPHIDHSRQLTDLINRHRVRLDSITKAERMLAEPPQYADDTTGAMASRWTTLVQRLEAVVCGLEEWSGNFELEFSQIQKDCACAMQRAYLKANYFATVDADFQLSEQDDGLVLMDLDKYPGYYIQVKEMQTDEGYATVAELKADPSVSGAHDAEVTEVVCNKWQAMAQKPDAKVNLNVAVHERKPTVTRAKRPIRRKALAAQI